MDEKKYGKWQVLAIILMIALLVAAFVLFFSGHYMVGFVLFGVFMLLLNFVSSWKALNNSEYVYLKNHKNNVKW
ncbi:hypothetical protein MKX57_17235 [Lysinibacillus sp. FSL M8-0216]|uniref:Uncharacterized protein n=1 Tax=Lysinibacillus fusiformis TaxID=28031 RepID=A0A1H9QLJ8_9BACI|nr:MULTISPECIES: hypothetical protein [Lysinibacillus]MED4670699.1 hypothetical protein [Lysinibacillus fusiformis]QAS56924.1 hypothetical protein LSP_11360 [Lysinibacillus sphaericus]RDV32444.1 hypothetical protein C7B90_10755 [Lysinibacillus fusiformis]SCX51837.1 hypothetical protein SAMN02787108_01828 [Lysinibacillus fusiformis]SCY78245.1 hypothetical protein SAMN02787081_04322 [Lysinibacillus fusiformis]